MMRQIRVHGDNIIECERTLKLICEAFYVTPQLYADAPIYKPVYQAIYADTTFVIELLPGHDRWGLSVANEIAKYGGVLREGADSYITEVVDANEKLLLAIEYCSALPAGNNAWQRNGRAFSCVLAGVPYLYYAEIGGIELDENREYKAPRFPNPIVPFSYISASRRFGVNCIPVYRPHPAIPTPIYKMFQSSFGMQDSSDLIKNLLLGIDYSEHRKTLNEKCISLIRTLSNTRRSQDTLKGDSWSHLYSSKTADKWLCEEQNSMVWSKKFSAKVAITDHFSKFKDDVLKLGCLSMGAKDIPISIIPKDKIDQFNKCITLHYPSVKHTFDNTKNLVVIWVVGYKPKGDDSRPDRGLTSLARMVLGNEIDILSIVYGPAKKVTHRIISALQGVELNGMWESILKLSDFALFDSVNYPSPIFHTIKRGKTINKREVVFDYAPASLGGVFGEHDIDTTIHQIFGINNIPNIKECFCNPPGGDWSGISYFTADGKEYRWTSLPRVSDGKRPDHIIQVKRKHKDLFLSIESKGFGVNLEDEIGIKLSKYINTVYKCIPTAIRMPDSKWNSNLNPVAIPPYDTITIGAFLYKGTEEMRELMTQKNLDAIIAVEFQDESTILHIVTQPKAKELIDIVKEIQQTVRNFEISVD